MTIGQIARYEIRSEIGTGSMGMVSEVWDHLRQETVALKLVKPSSRLDATTGRVALAQEFAVMASLRHPYIVSVYDYGFTSDGQAYFSMAYLDDAQTLTEAGQTADTEQKLIWILQLLEALSYLHRRGVLHHDLKPGNVLVSAGRVQVVDFGLSRSSGDVRGSSGGTLAYTAPEVLQKQSLTEVSELFSGGMLAYELLSGSYPFLLHPAVALINGILNEPLDFGQFTLLEDVQIVLQGLVAKDPKQRFPSAQIATHALQQALQLDQAEHDLLIRESYLQAASFVGREEELDWLQTALQQAVSRSLCCLVGGESGVGKSRLLDEFRIQALVAGWRVVVGPVPDGGVPYQVWRRILPHLVLEIDLSDLEASILQDIIPDIGRYLEREVVPAPELTGSGYSQRLNVTIAEVLRRNPQPITLVLEDLHWITNESLSVLQHLVMVVDQLPHLLIIGSYRDDERPNLPDELGAAQDVLSLSRLTDDAMSDLVASMLGQQALQRDDLVTLLNAESEGNTFFLVEMTRALAEEAGRLSEVIQLEQLPQQIMTGGMQTLLERRLAQVPQAYTSLLEMTAIMGRQIDKQLLGQLTSEAEVETWIRIGEATQLLTIQSGNCQFAHDKLREAILANLEDKQRSDYHRQVAQAIEQVYPENPAYHSVLLEHWHQAGNLGKELHYLDGVAEQLIEVSADYAQARDLLKRGLGQLPAEDPRRVDFLIWLSEAHWRQGQYEPASRYAQQALKLAQEVEDASGSARSLTNLGRVAEDRGDYQTANDNYLQSLTVHQSLGDEYGIARSLNLLGNIARRQGDYETANDYYLQSLTISQSLDNPQMIASCLTNLGVVADNLEDYETASQHYQQSLAIFQTLGDRHGVTVILTNLGVLAWRQGDYGIARDYYLQSLDISQTIGNLHGIALLLGNLGHVAHAQGDYEIAHDYYLQSLDTFRTIDDQRGIILTLTSLGFVAKSEGDYLTASDYFRRSLTFSQSMGNRQMHSYSLNNLGDILAELGELEQAQDLIQQSLALKREREDQFGAAYSLNSLAQLAYKQQDYPQAEALLQEAIMVYEAIGHRNELAISLNNLGFVYLQQQDERASGSFHQALSLAQVMQTPPLILEALLGFSWLYWQRKQTKMAIRLIQLVQQQPLADSRIHQRIAELQAVIPEFPQSDPSQEQEGVPADPLDILVEQVLRDFSS